LVDGAEISARQIARGLESCLPPPVVLIEPCQVPAVRVVGMVDAGRTVVRVTGVRSDATAVKVYANGSLIGTNEAPGGESTVAVVVAPLVEGQTVKAVQHCRIDSCPPADGRVVTPAGIIEDFENTVTIRDDPSFVDGGLYGVWYDAYDLAATSATVSTLFGSKCLTIWDHGFWNGVYAIYEQVIPADGTYHLELEVLIEEPEGSDYDFYNQYQVGAVVNGRHRLPSGMIDPIAAPVGYYRCLTPLRDGVHEIEPRKVYVPEFTARAGDDLLLAFSTDLLTFIRLKSASPPGQVGMKVDNIRLVPGPSPCLEAPLPTIVATESSPLEAGGVQVAVGDGVDALASQLRIYADGQLIGTQDLSEDPFSRVVQTSPLLPGQTLQATQIVEGRESCFCPSGDGPTVGTGLNSPLRVSLGIRETGGSGPIGANGGAVGPIEWVGANVLTEMAPQGKPLLPRPGWQEVTFAWSGAGGTDPVIAFTGNGQLEGAWGVLESFAFSIDGDNSGRYVIYIDRIWNGDTLLADFESPDLVGERGMFRQPSYSGSTRTHLLAYPDGAEVVAARGADGGQHSFRTEFQFAGHMPNRWMRLTTYDGSDTPDMAVQNPLIDLTQPVRVKFLLLPAPCSQPTVDADQDGDVDMVDFARLQRCFTGPALEGGAGPFWSECACLDYDRNWVIDADDFAMFAQCARGPGIATPAPCLPQ
jgi:hypothetical protein